MVNQVQVVAILMIVNGALISIMGTFYTFMGPMMFALMRAGPAGQTGSPADPVVMMAMPAIYLVIGLLVLTAGILNIVAGVRSLKFRGHTLALVALFSNLAPLFTCYCLPTSFGLMIYGLIVFFQADVAHAFAMVAQGAPPEEFKGGWRTDEEDDEREKYIPPSQTEPPRPGGDIQLGPNETFHRPWPEE